VVSGSGLPRTEPAALAVIALTYNGRHLLETFLPSLAAQHFRDFQVVIVDNGSSDGTVEWLAESWPDVRVVALKDNLGVTAALNVCLEAAAGADLVGLFNNDIELHPDCLGELVAAMRGHLDAGSAAAKLLDFAERDVIDGAGDIFFWQGTGWRRGQGEVDQGQYDQPQPVFGACGGAAVYRRAALDAVGSFDDDFFAFFEDVDWALRAQLAGFSCRYVPSAIAYHMGSATLGKGMTDFARYHLWRNSIWLVAKDYPVEALIRHAPALARAQLANLVVAARERKLIIWWRSLRDALLGLPKLLRKRWRVQRTRVIRVAELDLIIKGER
jgi:GT2 family glycosyltransferase